MKTQIRRCVFETNSSSVHTLSIVKNTNIKVFPEKVIFEPDDFGWENRSYTETSKKASYIWECIKSIYGQEQEELLKAIEKIKNFLYTYNIQCEFPYANIKVESWTDSNGKVHPYKVHVNDTGIKDNGYVDHAWDAKPFIDDILNDETKFINFLFDPRSFIITGNDNEDYYSESPDNGDADAWEYCKGN